MLRYHKKVYIDHKDIDRLKAFTDRLNGLNWHYTSHSIDNIKSRTIDLEGCLRFIKDLVLKADDMFEFYADNKSGDIIKVCYRVNWLKDTDIILVMSEYKEIITIYINSREDEHFTLKKELYVNN